MEDRVRDALAKGRLGDLIVVLRSATLGFGPNRDAAGETR